MLFRSLVIVIYVLKLVQGTLNSNFNSGNNLPIKISQSQELIQSKFQFCKHYIFIQFIKRGGGIAGVDDGEEAVARGIDGEAEEGDVCGKVGV